MNVIIFFNNKIIKIFVVFVIVLSVLTGCKKGIDIDFKTTNYNNIYTFAHSGIWINENAIYYTKSELYSTGFYYIDNTGKHKIFSDNTFSLKTKENTQGYLSSDIQVFYGNIYFWFVKENGERDFYKYIKNEDRIQKICSINKIINNWTVCNNFLIYSVYTDDLAINSLWFYDIDNGINEKIADKTTAFGIVNNEVYYIQRNNQNSNEVLSFNFKNHKSKFLQIFDGINGDYNSYNFSNNYIVYINNGMNIFDITSGKTNVIDLPEDIDFFSCYNDVVFLCSKNNVYRIQINAGETELLYDGFNDCELIHTIDEETAFIVNYDDSMLQTSVKGYIVKSNGDVSEIINI